MLNHKITTKGKEYLLLKPVYADVTLLDDRKVHQTGNIRYKDISATSSP